MAMIPISYSVRSLWVRRTSTVATAVGIAVVVFVLAGSQMLSTGIARTLSTSGQADHALVLRKGADAALSSTLEVTDVNVIGADPSVKRDATGRPSAVGEVLVVVAMPKQGQPSDLANVQLRGVPENGFSFRSHLRFVEGRAPRPGTDEVVVGKALRGRFEGLELEGQFELKRGRNARVVGIFDADGASFESEIWASLDTVQTSFGREGVVNVVTVQLRSPESFDSFERAMETRKELGFEALTETDYYEKQSEGMTRLIGALSGAIVFFFTIGAAIGAMITMYAAVQARTQEIGTLRALGFSRGNVLLSFLVEAVVLAFVSGVVGALGALALGMHELTLMNTATWSELTVRFRPTSAMLTSSLWLAVCTGLFGGFLPAWRAAWLSPVEAMRA